MGKRAYVVALRRAKAREMTCSVAKPVDCPQSFRWAHTPAADEHEAA